MTGNHIPPETVARLARNELAGEVLIETLRHLGTCAACAAAASPDLPAETAAVRNALTGEERKPRAWWLAVAAAVAGVLLLLALVTRNGEPRLQRPGSPRRVAAPPAVSTAPATPRPPYANAQWEELVRAALATGRLPFPADLEPLREQADQLRGAQNGSAITLEPAGVVIDETRPELRWSEQRGATCVVEMFLDGELVARSAPLRTNRWTPEVPLARGRTYVWQLAVGRGGSTVILPAPPAPPAMFRIVSAEEHRDIAAGLAAHPDDFLLHAVLHARAGMEREALAALRQAKQRGEARVRPLVENYLR